mgnify:CR=1 FL=1
MINKQLLVTLVLIVLSFGLVFFAILPLWDSIKLTKTQISEKEDRLDKVEGVVNKANELKGDYEKLKSKKEKLNLAIPERKKSSHLLIQLEEMAFNNGLLLSDINFGASSGSEAKKNNLQNQKEKSIKNVNLPSGVSVFTANVSINSSYGALKNFLKALENNIRIIDIKSIGLSTAGSSNSFTGSNSDILKSKLGFNVYYSK